MEEDNNDEIFKKSQIRILDENMNVKEFSHSSDWIRSNNRNEEMIDILKEKENDYYYEGDF